MRWTRFAARLTDKVGSVEATWSARPVFAKAKHRELVSRQAGRQTPPPTACTTVHVGEKPPRDLAEETLSRPSKLMIKKKGVRPEPVIQGP